MSQFQKIDETEVTKFAQNRKVESDYDTFKLLGIQLDQMLTWNTQIDCVCLNITCKITLMKML